MNYNNVIKAIDMITSPEGLGMSPKRIMVSTSGIPKMIKKLADDGVKFKLAVSLHSAIDEIRSRIMPFSENFPLADLREALEYWYRITKSKISYEYVGCIPELVEALEVVVCCRDYLGRHCGLSRHHD